MSDPRAHSKPPARLVTPAATNEDLQFDSSLRPRTLADFTGQAKVKEILEIAIESARRRADAMDHVLLIGPPGLGKTTLANIISLELGVRCGQTSGPMLQKKLDLTGIMTKMEPQQVFFIDEIHRLLPDVEEALYSVIEDFRIDVVVGAGTSAQTHSIPISRFTIIGATTRQGLISAPLRSRFGLVLYLKPYDVAELTRIVTRAAALIEAPLDAGAAEEIARRSRGTPRIANRLLRRVRDYALVRANGHITDEVAIAALDLLEVDRYGLDEVDRKIMLSVLEKFGGGPVRIRHHRRGDGRRNRHDRGGLRAVPDSARLPRTHAARPRRHAARLRVLRHPPALRTGQPGSALLAAPRAPVSRSASRARAGHSLTDRRFCRHLRGNSFVAYSAAGAAVGNSPALIGGTERSPTPASGNIARMWVKCGVYSSLQYWRARSPSTTTSWMPACTMPARSPCTAAVRRIVCSPASARRAAPHYRSRCARHAPSTSISRGVRAAPPRRRGSRAPGCCIRSRESRAPAHHHRAELGVAGPCCAATPSGRSSESTRPRTARHSAWSLGYASPAAVGSAQPTLQEAKLADAPH